MTADQKQHDELIKRLDKIQNLLQNLVILNAANAGRTRDEVRAIAGVKTARVAKIWKYVRPKKGT